MFGLDVICENADVLAGEVDDGRGVRWGSFRAETEGLKSPTVGIGAKG
uniref:Uncharacterized protein n=1 Tax=Leptospira santarosai serovar Arenal str. MAVJ 401 TaxID=1049976 RepID=M6JGI1_9LEPT|nr:hypothetical protein LEP1GSC063_2852 [Leptospira santarosai serovar Arenal str. MAVJ 401]